MAERAKVVLVTGASAGIGLACADLLHEAGWAVVGASRRGTAAGSTPGTATASTPGIQTGTATGSTAGSAAGRAGLSSGDAAATASTAATTPAAAGGWSGLVMDVDDDDSVCDGVRGIISAHGRLDAIVAAAGWGVAGPVELTTVAEAKAQLETNFWGCVRVVRAALPAMRAQGGGRIVLISSIGGVLGVPFQAFYSASKFALEGYGEALAYEVAPFGIEVTLVQPGNVRTDFTANRQMAAAARGESVYSAALAKAVGLMERDEINGAPAGDVAAVVRRVLTARRPPRRVSVGKAGERIGLLAKRVLPFRVFEAGAKSSLGVG
jgi:NAD(P)-dependent dehydrogenase (short-subunit alcohol dehydrogenase family)